MEDGSSSPISYIFHHQVEVLNRADVDIENFEVFNTTRTILVNQTATFRRCTYISFSVTKRRVRKVYNCDHIVQTRIRIPAACFSIEQESESDTVLESVSGNVNEPIENLA